MVAINATSAWLVQMLEVAFSRRMCCSRVERVRTKPRRALLVDGLAGEAAGHLAENFSLGGDDAAVRAAVAERDAEGLRFHGDDVGFRGRLHDAERDGFGDGDDQQRAFFVHDLGDGGDVFDRRRRSWATA